MANSRIALAYCRVSTRAQAEKWSLPAQRRALEEHARRQGWDCELLEETGSGESVESRPVFRAALARIAAGGVHTLLVIEFERLSRARDLRDLELVKGICRAAGCRIATPSQALDLGDADDDFLHSLFSILSTREKQKLLARQKRGIAEARAAGRWHGGGVPTGYRYDREAQTIVPDPETAPVVRELLRRALTEGARGLRRHFPQFSPTCIQRTISRQRVWWYAGRIEEPDGTLITAAWAPLITEEEALALHSARKRKATVRANSPQARRLLTGMGIFRCGRCGASVKSQRSEKRLANGRTDVYLAYRCNPWALKMSANPCPNRRNISCRKIDPAILRALWEHLPRLLRASRMAQERRSDPSPASPLAGELAAATARRDRLVAAVEDGTLTGAEVRDRLAEARREIARLTQALEDEREPLPVEIPAELDELLAHPPARVPMPAARELIRLTCRLIELESRESLRIVLVDGTEVPVRIG